jgi:phage FluMu gp28-like protein
MGRNTHRGVDYALGQDFGRSGDLSTIDVLGQKSPTRWDTVVMVEMRNIPFDVQQRIARWVGDNLPSWRRWKLDARGNGHSHAEALMQEYGSDRVECVQLTGQWYDEWFPKYKAAFEGQNRGIPATEDVIDDHRQVVLVAGSPRMSASRTKGSDGLPRHGDSAVSGVLAWSAAVGGAQPSAGETVDAKPGGFTPSRGNRSGGMFGPIKERTHQRAQERAQRREAMSARLSASNRKQAVPERFPED